MSVGSSLLLVTMVGALALGPGACGGGAASAASPPPGAPSATAARAASPDGPEASVRATPRASVCATPRTSATGIAAPDGPPLVGDPGQLPAVDLPVRTLRLRSWWNVVDHSDRFLAVNRAVAGAPTAQDADGIREEHHLVDMGSGARRLVRRHCVAGPAWWSMARAVSDAGWLAWEEVRGQSEDRWRLYAARFDRRTLRVGRPRLVLRGERRRVDRPHFALYGRRLVSVTNSYGSQSEWGSRGWAFVTDLATGKRQVLYSAPVSVGDLCVAANGTVALVEYTDPVDVHSARFVVVRIADGAVLLRHRHRGGPVRKIAWDGRNLAWEAEQDDAASGYRIIVRRADGSVRLISDAGLAPALSGGTLFFTDYQALGVDDRVISVDLRDWTAGRLAGRGDVSTATASPRHTVVWDDGSGDDTVIRVGRLP